MKKIFIISGTRPEVIKLYPVYRELRKVRSFDVYWISTGQHREMLLPMFSFFGIEPYRDLALMKHDQDLLDITINVLTSVKALLVKERPDGVIVQGDTTTAMASSLAAFSLKIEIAHVEAGLRSYNIQSPYPEEANRRIVSSMAAFHFAPTTQSKKNLIKENVPGRIFVTGNTVIDALKIAVKKIERPLIRSKYHTFAHYVTLYRGMILITGHRRENFGAGFESICFAIKRLATRFPDFSFVYPVHLNPNVRGPVYKILNSLENVFLIDPVPYDVMVYLMTKCKLVLTDSGGIQEEAPSLGKPVLVMRNTTERPEGIKAGCAKLVGVSEQKIVKAVYLLLTNHKEYNKMAKARSPYGDGTSARKIVAGLKKFMK